MNMRRVVSGVALRTLATRGRKREDPHRRCGRDGAKRKVRRAIPLATTQQNNSSVREEGWSEAEGPKDNTACDHTQQNNSSVRGRDGAKRKVRRTIPLAVHA